MKARKHPHEGPTLQQVIARWREERPGFSERFDRAMLAAEVRQARKDAGITQTELAVAAHTQPAVISRLERGRSLPSLDTLQKVATALNRRLEIRLAE
ncbi:helix-turn-helix domain-containing protein [Myxococcota bacterium]|nr:helix-turn-helix domain-containing protein [Myxococcota bacterium]